MNTRVDPQELVVQLIDRSICAVKVAAVLVDRHGVVGWGWNSVGNGYGQCAEESCLTRCNWKRVGGATMFIAGERMRTGKPVTAKPCERCHGLLLAGKVKRVVWRDKSNHWRNLTLA